MSQPLAGVLALGVLLAVARARERPGGAWGVAGGLLLGALALTRPFDAVLLGVVAAAWAIGIGARRLAWRDLVGGLVAAATVGALALPYNAALTGRATLAPHNVWMDRAWGPGRDRLGFGADIGNNAWPNLDPLPGHGPADVVLNLNKNVFQGNADLFGWACGSLLLVMAGVLMGHRRRGDGLAAGVILSFAGGYSLYWFSGGPDLGPRYWYPALVPFVVLSVRGAQAVAERLEEAGRAPRWRVYAFVAMAAVSAAVTVPPWRAATKYYRYRGVSADVRRLAAQHGFGRSLVLIRSREREDYQSAFSLNPTDFDAPVPVYARDAGHDHMALVLARFPDRPVWIIGRRDPSVAQLDVLSGPLLPGVAPP
jgi:4-amino-4-deoxy-L-arabinose transferase-like glycosyltransferase